MPSFTLIMPTKAYIAIYVGDQLDYTKYRHTALDFEFPSKPILLHIVGASGIYEYDRRENYNPRVSQTIAKLLEVAMIPDSLY